MNKRRTLITVAVVLFCGFLALHAIATLTSKPLTLTAISTYGVDGNYHLGFIAGHTLCVRYQIDNPNVFPRSAQIRIVIEHRPIFGSASVVFDQQETVLVMPGAPVQEYRITIPPDAQGRFVVTVAYETQYRQQVFLVV